MLAVLKPQSQVTIPSNIISSLGLKEGDKLDISEDNGTIRIMPIAVYPKAYLNELQAEIAMLKENIKNGKQPVFDNLDSLFEHLEES